MFSSYNEFLHKNCQCRLLHCSTFGRIGLGLLRISLQKNYQTSCCKNFRFDYKWAKNLLACPWHIPVYLYSLQRRRTKRCISKTVCYKYWFCSPCLARESVFVKSSCSQHWNGHGKVTINYTQIIFNVSNYYSVIYDFELIVWKLV